jgi:hypothetical protein
MTRLDRVSRLLYNFNIFEGVCIECLDIQDKEVFLEKLRKEKEKLTQELIEHGCRRKN